MNNNWMKKIGKLTSILLVSVLVFTGCGAGNETKNTKQDATVSKAEELVRVRASAASQGQDLWFGIVEEFTTEAYEALSEINAYALDNGNYDSAFDVADFLDLEAVSEAFPENVSYQNPS